MGFNIWRCVDVKPQTFVEAPKRIYVLQYVSV